MSEVRFLAASWTVALVLVGLCLSGCGSDQSALTGPGVSPLPQQQTGTLGAELATITSFVRLESPSASVKLTWDVVGSPISNFEIQICDASGCRPYVNFECSGTVSCRVIDAASQSLRTNISFSGRSDLSHTVFVFRDFLTSSLGGGSVSLKIRSYVAGGQTSVWFGDTHN